MSCHFIWRSSFLHYQLLNFTKTKVHRTWRSPSDIDVSINQFGDLFVETAQFSIIIKPFFTMYCVYPLALSGFLYTVYFYVYIHFCSKYSFIVATQIIFGRDIVIISAYSQHFVRVLVFGISGFFLGPYSECQVSGCGTYASLTPEMHDCVPCAACTRTFNSEHI